MSTSDRPIHDVIAEAAYRGIDWDFVEVFRGEPGEDPGYGTYRDLCADVAAAVLAACQQATVAQQAELTNAEVERRTEAIYEGIYLADERIESRLVGPWREDPS